MIECLEIALPYPPSVNHYWRHTRQGRHYISAEGRNYQNDVFLAFLGTPMFKTPVSISVDVYFPDSRKRDLDNLAKVVLDSLVNARIIEDDCWQFVPELHWVAAGVKKGGEIVVKIKGIGNEEV